MPSSEVEKLSVAPDAVIDDVEIAVRIGAVSSSVVKEIVDTAETFPIKSSTTT